MVSSLFLFGHDIMAGGSPANFYPLIPACQAQEKDLIFSW
jgi:hypothetical protein